MKIALIIGCIIIAILAGKANSELIVRGKYEWQWVATALVSTLAFLIFVFLFV